MPTFFIDIYQVLKPQLAAHGLVFIAYALFFVGAKPLLNFFNRGKDVSARIRIMRAGIVFIFILHLVDILFLLLVKREEGDPDPQHVFIKIGYSIAATYAGLIACNVVSYFSRKKFGLEKKIDDEIVYLDTYNSRLMDIVIYVVVFFLWIYTIILIWDLTSQLQTTGFIGIVLGFLALTNGIWLPDIYYGMVILNSHLLEDGDVIKFNNHPNENVISRVSFVYTILLDLRNNHRLLVRNSQLIGGRIDNLTKRASIDGLRHTLHFNIGYPKPLSIKSEEGEAGYGSFRQQVQQMFDKAFEILKENTDCKINRNLPFEVAVVNSADYALTFSLSYYLEAIPNTKITKTLRQYLVKTPALIQDAVNQVALEENIQLATPVLIDHKAVSA
jgi:hypothetical protein